MVIWRIPLLSLVFTPNWDNNSKLYWIFISSSYTMKTRSIVSVIKKLKNRTYVHVYRFSQYKMVFKKKFLIMIRKISIIHWLGMSRMLKREFYLDSLLFLPLIFCHLISHGKETPVTFNWLITYWTSSGLTLFTVEFSVRYSIALIIPAIISAS